MGEILIDARLVHSEQIDAARTYQLQTGLRVGEALVALGHVSEDDVAWALSRQLHLPYVYLTPEMITGAVSRIPMNVMEHHRLLPVVESGDSITIVLADPTDHEAIAEVARLTGLSVLPAVGLANNIQVMLNHLRDGKAAAVDSGVRALLFHVSAATHAGATEVYFDPTADGVRIRYRTPRGLTAHQDPGIASDALEAAARAVGTPAGNRRRVLAVPEDVAPSAEILWTLVPTHHGTAVLASIGRRSVPGITLSSVGVDPVVAAGVDEAVRTGCLVIIGTPDPAFRRLALATLASTSARSGRARVVCLGLPSTAPDPGVVTAGLESGAGMAEGLADVVVADVGPEFDHAARLAHLRRPGQLLILGTPHLYADAAVGEVTELLGPWWTSWSLTAVLTGSPVPVLCSCARPMLDPLPTWPMERLPTRWGAPVGCDRCRQTGFSGTTFLCEWFWAGAHLADLGPAGSAGAFAALARRYAAPAMEDSVLLAVERLQVGPDDAARLLGRSRWRSRNS